MTSLYQTLCTALFLLFLTQLFTVQDNFKFIIIYSSDCKNKAKCELAVEIDLELEANPQVIINHARQFGQILKASHKRPIAKGLWLLR